jgi:hypothetical protein
MKIRWMLVAAAVMISAAAFADEVSNALANAQKLCEAKKYVEAKAEIEKALAAVQALVKAATPAPEAKDRTYINYEFNFRVKRPEKEWEVQALTAGSGGAGATFPLCQLVRKKEGAKVDDAVICYVRDLKGFYGARYDSTVKGNEVAFMKLAGKQMASSVKQLEDAKVTGQTELTISGSPAVRTDYTARKGDKPMKCFTVDIMRGHMLFSAVFVGAAANDKDAAPAFKEILDSIDLSAAPPPEKGK